MTKKQFYEKYFPYVYREEHQTFKEDIDRLVEDEIYQYTHSDADSDKQKSKTSDNDGSENS